MDINQPDNDQPDNDPVISLLQTVREQLDTNIARDCITLGDVSAGPLSLMPAVRRGLAGLTAESLARMVLVDVAIEAVMEHLPNARDIAYSAVDDNAYYTSILTRMPGMQVTLH